MANINGLDWPLGLFIAGVIVSIALAWFFRVFGLLLLVVVIAYGTGWQPPLWVWVIFWIIWMLTFAFFVASFFQSEARKWARGFGYTMTVIVALLMVVSGTSSGGPGPGPISGPTPSPTVTSTTTVTAPPVTITQSPSSTVNANQVINELVGKGQPFEAMKGYLKVGSDQVDFKVNPEERGTAAFSTKTLKSQQDVAQFLTGSSDRSKAANSRVVSAITKAGYGTDEVDRALNGSGYFPVQATVAAQIMGTTYFHNGKVLEMGTWRTVGPNDIFWLFMTKDGKIIYGAAIRADCGNANLERVRPIVPSTPPAPSVECVEKCKPVTPPTTTTTTRTTPPTHTTTTKPPKDCADVFGPGYKGTFPNCKKDGSASVQPTQPPSAPGTNPAPVPVTKSNTTQPTSAQCYDPVTGDPVPPGTPGAWCS